MLSLEWANFAATAAAVLAASAAAWFAGATYLRDGKLAMADEARNWNLEYDMSMLAIAPETPADWKPFALVRDKRAPGVKILRLEIVGPGTEIAPAVHSEQINRALWRPDLNAIGRAFVHRTRNSVDYSVRFFAKWPSASRFRSSARLEIRVTFEEVSANRRQTKIVVRSIEMALTAKTTA